MAAVLRREAVATSRLLEFFTAKELRMQVGFGPEDWALALTKELIDNALDACESAGITPEVAVRIDGGRIAVEDNGPGIPAEVIERSLDYSVRVSTNSHYVSPTRGQLGNALKCVWAAPFVLDGQRGLAEVRTRGESHRIEVRLDPIAQEPLIDHRREPADVKTGTSVAVHWPEEACLPEADGGDDFYFEAEPDRIEALVCKYVAFNPHAAFRLARDGHEAASGPARPAWRKWSPARPTSAHWYDPDRFETLLASLLAGGYEKMTVREFMSKFDGLAGSASRRKVFALARPPGPLLSDLVTGGGDLDRQALGDLLGAMKEIARPVKPDALGMLGREHMAFTAPVFCTGEAPEEARYKCVKGKDPARPFVLEVAFAVKPDSREQEGRTIAVGLNWSPALENPFPQLAYMLGQQRIDPGDPVALIVHLACPRIDFTDRGKSRVNCDRQIHEALADCVRSVTRDWRKAKLHQEQVSRAERARMRRARPRELSVKEAAYRVMEEAYRKASGDGKDPANARQIMYAARPLVLELTGGKCWKNSATFTQQYLIDFMEEHPDLTRDWDVVFDARGHFREPHTGRQIGLGTLEVRKYVAGWRRAIPPLDAPALSADVPTSGPANRYRHVLFVEKEGFGSLLERHQIAERFDLAVMSTKGMSVTAARSLVDRLGQEGATIFVLRDFDKAGFSISHTLAHNSRRYKFRTPPRVIDLGLRLSQAEAMGLESEPVSYSQKADPRERLRECGATEDECAFLVDEQEGEKLWGGRRVELNAMTSPQFIEFLEARLLEHGVEKFVPGEEALAAAYRRAKILARVQEAIDREMEQQEGAEAIEVPEDLLGRVQERIKETTWAWDEVVGMIAEE